MFDLREIVIEYARQFWEECPDDFGIQYEDFDSIIFGGTNRVVWNVRMGFRIDESYCTDKFIAHYRRLERG